MFYAALRTSCIPKNATSAEHSVNVKSGGAEPSSLHHADFDIAAFGRGGQSVERRRTGTEARIGTETETKTRTGTGTAMGTARQQRRPTATPMLQHLDEKCRL